MKRLVPRDLPPRGGFSVPAGELRWNTHQLYAQLAGAVDAAAEEMKVLAASAEVPIVPQPMLILHVQLYSRAVQVFAAMAVESALNTYGLIRFGDEQFSEYERKVKAGPRRKLIDLLDHDRARKPGNTDSIMLAVDGLIVRRNSLVHQKSDESTLDEQQRFTFTTKPQQPNVSVEAATQSFDDMELFFHDFPQRDPQVASLLHFPLFDM